MDVAWSEHLGKIIFVFLGSRLIFIVEKSRDHCLFTLFKNLSLVTPQNSVVKLWTHRASSVSASGSGSVNIVLKYSVTGPRPIPKRHKVSNTSGNANGRTKLREGNVFTSVCLSIGAVVSYLLGTDSPPLPQEQTHLQGIWNRTGSDIMPQEGSWDQARSDIIPYPQYWHLGVV